MSIFDLMLLPFLECIVLVGIHSYLGLHVIRRRIIFVDLALAQIAALGATAGLIFGIEPDTLASFVYSLTFCVIGAAVFSLSRVRDDRVPQEAVIGLVYAITASMAVLVVQKLEGVEHMESILVGSLLWVRGPDIAAAAAAYSLVGLVHYVFRKQFYLISFDTEEAYKRGMNVKLWDFLFYLTFGFVISISVRVAGVLLVFVFLVAPAILAVIVAQKLRSQLLVGWGVGTVVTVAGLYISYILDLPCGPSVVTFYGIFLLMAVAAIYVFKADSRMKAISHVGVTAVVMVLVGFLLTFEGRALGKIAEKHHEEEIARHLELEKQAESEHRDEEGLDPEGILEKVEAALKMGDRPALVDAVRLLESEETPLFFKEEAYKLIMKEAGRDFGYSAEKSVKENAEALRQINHWLGCTSKPGGQLREP